MTDEKRPDEPMAADAALDITETADLFESVQADLTKADPEPIVADKEDEDEDVYDPHWSSGQKNAWFKRHGK